MMRPTAVLSALALMVSLVLVPDVATATATGVPEPDDGGVGHRLASRLTGEDIAISEARFAGAAGTASRFDDVESLGLREGISLATGTADSAVTRTAGDGDLTALLRGAGIGRTTKEASVVEFDLVPTSATLAFRYAFASDEAGAAGQPDVFGLWVDGVNVATTDDGGPVTAHTMLADATPAPELGYAQVSTVRTALATVVPGESVHVKIAIADAAHATGNSAVFVEANNRTPVVGAPVLTEDFEAGMPDWEFPRQYTFETVDDGTGNTVLTTDPATPGLQRAVTGFQEWRDYTVSARVRTIEFTKSRAWVSLIGRYLDDDNYYQVQMMGNAQDTSITIRRRAEGAYAYVAQRHDWAAPVGEWTDMTMVLSGALIEFYVNGELVISGTDHVLTHGRPGIQADLGSEVQIDDFTVAPVENPAITGPPIAVAAGTYYASPTGDDDNPGTEQLPWRSVTKASQVAGPGTTVIFEDGTYDETQTTTFVNSGTASERIVLRSRNPHGAKIVYHDLPASKLSIIDRTHITIQGFEITENVPGPTTADILVEVRTGAHHVHILDNYLHGAHEEGVKGYLVEGMVVRGNLIEDMGHEGIDFVNVWNSVIENNVIRDVGRVGLLAKGGSVDITIRNNVVTALNRTMMTGAIYLGGSTDGISTKDPTLNGFEAWNMVAYNNIVHGTVIDGVPTIPYAFSFTGAKDSAIFHNVVVGARYGLFLASGGHLPTGWEWQPNNVNVTFANNIVVDVAAGYAIRTGTEHENFVHDHNLYHQTDLTPPVEPGGVYADPQFVAVGTDWHLAPTSPARDVAPCIPTFTLFDGSTINVLDDFDGELRTGTTCSLGAYR
ncbi:choice-of-anchor L domain-containing protein [Microlunatus sp. Y2014]|uniref:choice-of-anchor L domain-containing protein n=1 Tax=Microlunatus sp. Y2014 TaxID=3418488 RepID=UPI003DA6E031